MVLQSSYLYNGNPYTWKDGPDIETEPLCFIYLLQTDISKTLFGVYGQPVLLVHAKWCKSTIIICFMAMKYNQCSQSRIIQNVFQGDGLTPVWHQATCGIQTGWCGFIYQVSLCWPCSCTNKYEQEFSTNMRYFPQTWDIDGSTQDCGNSSALALELPQSCVESSIWSPTQWQHQSYTDPVPVNNGTITGNMVTIIMCHCTFFQFFQRGTGVNEWMTQRHIFHINDYGHILYTGISPSSENLVYLQHWKTWIITVPALHAGLILGLCPANERHHYKVTPSLIGWVQT